MKIGLTRRGDYAMRAIITLARPGTGQQTGWMLAESTGIPPSYLPQVMGDLVRGGIVANRLGRKGGYRLARRSEDVSLLEVIEAVEGDGRSRTCVLRGGPCRGQPDGACDVHDAFVRAQEAAFECLASISVADVVPRSLRETVGSDR